jgi:FdhD protein
MQEVEIQRIDVSDKKRVALKDCVAEEKSLHLFLNRKYYATISCTPSNLKELAIGHLLAEGIIETVNEVEKVEIEAGVCRVKLVPSFDLDKRLRLQKHYGRVVFSACGNSGVYTPMRSLPKIKQGPTVKADIILRCVSQLNSSGEIFKRTGGVHAAAVFKTSGSRLSFAEDIGRHNAVDKALGMMRLREIDPGDCLLTLTGRLTGDIVAKTARMKIPIVASIAAAIDSGIMLAKKANLTLIGFARRNRMNIYSCPERILS